MPFSNPIFGGDFLVRPALKSPNYVAGVSGWSINKDGTVEFNNGVFRGSIQIGTNPGQHIIIANPATGDAVDVYDVNNVLVYKIDNSGRAVAYYPPDGGQYPTGASATHASAFYAIDANGDDVTFQLNAHFVGQPQSAPSAKIAVTPANGGAYNEIAVYGGSQDGTFKATTTSMERGVSGSFLQADQQSVNNLTHRALYTLVTGATGQFNQVHNCGFTPKGATVTQEAGGAGSIPIGFIMFNTFTATNFVGQAWNGAALFTNNNVAAYIEFWG